MKYIYCLLSVMLFTSCGTNSIESIETPLVQKAKTEIAEEQVNLGIDENTIFENNLKCVGQKDSIEKYSDKYLSMSGLTQENLKGESIIFYSPKTNSCLFSIWTVFEIDDQMTYSFRLFEYGTNNEIIMRNYSCDLNTDGDISEQAEYFGCAKDKNDMMMDLVEDYRK